MNKEDILKAAQAEASEQGEYETEQGKKSVIIATASGLLLCALMIAFELVKYNRVDYGKPAIIFFMISIMNFYEGIKTNQKKKVILATVEMILAIISLIIYIGALF